MASNPNHVKKQIAVDTVSWTAVVAPVDCMAVSIKNSVFADMRIRTDSADATTQDTISAGSIETVSAPRHSSRVQDGASGSRFETPHDHPRGHVHAEREEEEDDAKGDQRFRVKRLVRLRELTRDDRALIYGAFLELTDILRGETREQTIAIWRRRGSRAFKSETVAPATLE